MDLFGTIAVKQSQSTDGYTQSDDAAGHYEDNIQPDFFLTHEDHDDPFEIDAKSLEQIQEGLIEAIDSMNGEPDLDIDATKALAKATIVKPPSRLMIGSTIAAQTSPNSGVPMSDEVISSTPPVRIQPRSNIPRFGAPAPVAPAPAPSLQPAGEASHEEVAPAAPAVISRSAGGRRGGGLVQIEEDGDEVSPQSFAVHITEPKGLSSAFVAGNNESIIIGRFERTLREDREKGNWFGVTQYEDDQKLPEAKISLSLESRQSIGRNWFEAVGTWKENIFQGRPDKIFNVRAITTSLPRSKRGAKTFLVDLLKSASCRFTGSGLDQWIEKYGEACLYRACSYPEMIEELTTSDDKAMLRAHWSMATQGIAAKIVLEAAGLSEVAIGRVLGRHGKDTLKQMRENPYLLLSVDGVTFQDAENVAAQMGVEKHDRRRLLGYVHALTMEAEKNGSTAIDAQSLEPEEGDHGMVELNNLPKLLGTPSSAITSPLYFVNLTRPLVAHAPSYRNERDIAEALARHLNSPPPGKLKHITPDVVENIARSVLPDKKLDEGQINAVVLSANSRISLLTGGPGTGKSTVTKVLVEVLKYMGNERIEVVAPVGRAARKAGEMSGVGGQTIHRRLGARRGVGGRMTFEVNENNRIEEGTSILGDEWSMTDSAIGAAFANALPTDNLRLTMIGDINQLPPVGAGQVMVDLMKASDPNGAPLVPTSRLTKIFRTDESGGIAVGAAEINSGVVPDIKRVKSLAEIVDGGVGLAQTTASSIWRHVSRLVQEVKDEGMDPMRDVFVLSAMRMGKGGVFELNQVLSQMLNPHGQKFLKADRYYDPRMAGASLPRMFDRVMINENDMNLDVMNGDLGVIINADEKSIFIQMDDERTVQYPMKNWHALTLGYAGTIHKAQGSQFPVTIMAVAMSQAKMLERRLFYTGWTRAMNKLIVVGEPSAIDLSVETSRAYERTTMLTDFIEDYAMKQRAVPAHQQQIRMAAL